MFSASLLGHATLEAVYVYFNTASYDEIERDEKVMFWSHFFYGRSAFINPIFEGDNRGPVGFDRGHHGPSHWLFHPQWSRDHLLPSQASFIFLINSFITDFDFLSFSFLRFFMSLKIPRTEIVSSVKKRFENHLTTKD